MIRAICFDLDDTLWPCKPTIQRAEQELHTWLSHHYPRLAKRFSIEAMYTMRLHLLAENPHLRCDTSSLRKLNLAQAAAQVGYSDELVEPAFAVFYQARQQVHLYDDVIPTLERLYGHYLLISLTNGNADVNQTHIGHLFDLSLLSSEVGAAKPHPALFQAACAYAGVAPACMVHVGDDTTSDVEGALAIGMRAVWLNRYHQVWSGAGQPDATITTLFELETVLARWNRSQINRGVKK